MFEKVLIANRGEIALRVIRACRELGIKTVAVYSTADADSEPVRLADEAVHIGPPPAPRSYLYPPNIVEAAIKTGADAVHPGYGFLSEDPYFAEICAAEGLTFVGPPPEVMELVGDKATARRLMAEAGLPLLPGTTEPVAGADDAMDIADDIGYPVVLKAVAGGGGRGIAVVRDRADLPDTYQRVRAHAQQVFGNGALYLERYLQRARHVEIQVLADADGATIHLGERDCSVQRRHQKLVEEAPSSAVDEPLRASLGAAAVLGAASIGYRGAGTMEFLLDEDGAFWFMEMNARIQVEHPVTEMVTGVDLVTEQIRTAAGRQLTIGQDDVALSGHAIECRVNAEDPDRGFMPAPGRLDVFVPPGGPGTRVDTHCRPGSTIPPSYDSLIAKVIVWGPDREAALDRMDRALGEFRIEGPGVRTTIPFHRRVLEHPVFRKGDLATDFLEKHMT